MHLQKVFHLENNEIVTFKISCRPDFQDKYVLMFAGMFLRVLPLFRTIPKSFAFCTYLTSIKTFTVVLQLKLLSLEAISVAEMDMSLQGYSIRYLIPYTWF